MVAMATFSVYDKTTAKVYDKSFKSLSIVGWSEKSKIELQKRAPPPQAKIVKYT